MVTVRDLELAILQHCWRARVTKRDVRPKISLHVPFHNAFHGLRNGICHRIDGMHRNLPQYLPLLPTSSTCSRPFIANQARRRISPSTPFPMPPWSRSKHLYPRYMSLPVQIFRKITSCLRSSTNISFGDNPARLISSSRSSSAFQFVFPDVSVTAAGHLHFREITFFPFPHFTSPFQLACQQHSSAPGASLCKSCQGICPLANQQFLKRQSL